MSYLVSNFITKKDYFIIGNIGMIIEKDESMKKTINKNDLVIINRRIDKLKEDDIIAINKENKTIISKIYQIEENNNIIFTKGDNNIYPDNDIYKKENIEGKFVFKIPFIGFLFILLQSKIMTVITIVLLVFKFLINKEGKRRTINVIKEKL